MGRIVEARPDYGFKVVGRSTARTTSAESAFRRRLRDVAIDFSVPSAVAETKARRAPHERRDCTTGWHERETMRRVATAAGVV